AGRLARRAPEARGRSEPPPPGRRDRPGRRRPDRAGRRPRPRALPNRPGGAPERPPPLAGATCGGAAAYGRRGSTARGRGRRHRLRADRVGTALAAVGPDLDGGAGAAARRPAGDPLRAGRGHRRAPGGGPWLSRSASWSSTIT